MTTHLNTQDMGCPYQHPPVMPRDGTPFRPSPQFAQWRAEAPATRLTAEDGNVGWFVTGYELARQVLQDPRFSMSDRRTPLGPTPLPMGKPIDAERVHALMVGNVLGLDPPQHTRIRRAAVGRFSVRGVRRQRPAIGEFIERRLDEILAAGPTADLFEDFAVPVSVFAHCRVLGIPDAKAEEFTAIFATDELRFGDMVEFAADVLDLKAADLVEDTISDLLRSELTGPERLGIVTVLMGSGRDAIAYMIGTIMVSLLSDPGQLETLRREPERIPAAVEEFVRFHAMFVSTHPRTVAEDLTLEGIDFRKGEPVWVSTVAASRDGERFPDPDTFDVTREASGHLAFGHGIHACIGQQLARVVIAEAITLLLARLPALRLVEAEQQAPMAFAGDLPTYAPGTVRVAWDQGSERG
ncbi:cytochrome P450 [Spongiactinospora gelatinilytica]|uniref:Cytochrome P450 n=1 Tax=Spongiactinospora gelatinilytica TaxID=2666298 RepID=A0A2W2I4Y8_9ACTN|nr:cytochrome P450 [Spongiactinospora gelatinilytica]PZG53217.1 cytochrome P450 [Spongiactinospora gelatinilytica]